MGHDGDLGWRMDRLSLPQNEENQTLMKPALLPKKLWVSCRCCLKHLKPTNSGIHMVLFHDLRRTEGSLKTPGIQTLVNPRIMNITHCKGEQPSKEPCTSQNMTVNFVESSLTAARKMCAKLYECSTIKTQRCGTKPRQSLPSNS